MKLSFLFIILLIYTSCKNTKELTLADKAKIYTYAYNYHQQQDCEGEYVNMIDACVMPLDTFSRDSIVYYDFIFTDCKGNNTIPCNCSFTGFGFDKLGKPVRLIKHHKAIFEFDYNSFRLDIMLKNLKEKIITSSSSNSWLMEHYSYLEAL